MAPHVGRACVALLVGSALACDKMPAPWACYKDPSTGADYYYNTETKKTTWDKPDLDAAKPTGDDDDDDDGAKADGPCIPEGDMPTGNEACEGYGYDEDKCKKVGCCDYHGTCWANIDSAGETCKNWNREMAGSCKSKKNGKLKYLGAHLTKACHTDKDFKVWQESGAANFDEDLRKCGSKCWGKADCVRDCVLKQRDYTEDCATCFGDVSACTVMKCSFDCVNGETHQCDDCNRIACAGMFIKCSGIPKGQIHGGSSTGRRLVEEWQQLNRSSSPLVV
eukprot:TRINITY_DN1620_c0_g1_i1.p1 TRINITY_DN1620_c0_g1~~TRINITY_DN1620_c0_g1_i1.p1  ORF type:complete len:279 (-),score=78.52 TRINITY_DN1620_c0_g1_i1:546-1382(-)